jgi:hypothetical protein
MENKLARTFAGDGVGGIVTSLPATLARENVGRCCIGCLVGRLVGRHVGSRLVVGGLVGEGIEGTAGTPPGVKTPQLQPLPWLSK